MKINSYHIYNNPKLSFSGRNSRQDSNNTVLNKQPVNSNKINILKWSAIGAAMLVTAVCLFKSRKLFNTISKIMNKEKTEINKVSEASKEKIEHNFDFSAYTIQSKNKPITPNEIFTPKEIQAGRAKPLSVRLDSHPYKTADLPEIHITSRGRGTDYCTKTYCRETGEFTDGYGSNASNIKSIQELLREQLRCNMYNEEPGAMLLGIEKNGHRFMRLNLNSSRYDRVTTPIRNSFLFISPKPNSPITKLEEDVFETFLRTDNSALTNNRLKHHHLSTAVSEEGLKNNEVYKVDLKTLLSEIFNWKKLNANESRAKVKFSRDTCLDNSGNNNNVDFSRTNLSEIFGTLKPGQVLGILPEKLCK